MKRTIKISIIAIASFTILYVAFAAYVKLNNPNPLFMDYRYNKVITEPLAKMGFSDAQYKMGLFWYYGGIGSLDESQIPKKEVENAIYWWEKASANGNDKATQELARIKNQTKQTFSAIEKIDNELYELYSGIRDSYGDWENADKNLNLFVDRLKYHLADSVTFKNDLPRTDSLISIHKTPDGKYKFYSLDDGMGGTMRRYMTFVQFIDANGKLNAKQWNEEDYNDHSAGTGLLTDIWQFQHKGIDYYVAKLYYRSSSIDRSYRIEVFTISNGKPTHHTEFLPENPYFVATSCNPDNEIECSFDSKTKTIHYTTYETIDSERNEKQIKGSWKLKLK